MTDSSETNKTMKPLSAGAWHADLSDVLAELKSPANIHGVMANHPRLLNAWMPFRNHIVRESTLSAKQRELLILRTAHRCGADYEWHHHVERAQSIGLSMSDIDSIRAETMGSNWSAAEQNLLQAVDDLTGSRALSPETLSQLTAEFDKEQILDIVFTVGMYITLALTIRSFEVPLEDDLKAVYEKGLS